MDSTRKLSKLDQRSVKTEFSMLYPIHFSYLKKSLKYSDTLRLIRNFDHDGPHLIQQEHLILNFFYSCTQHKKHRRYGLILTRHHNRQHFKHKKLFSTNQYSYSFNWEIYVSSHLFIPNSGRKRKRQGVRKW
jgi:hypothetical protein